MTRPSSTRKSSNRSTPRPYRSPLREHQAASTRELIVRAVGEQLARGGIEDLSVARVARRAGVSERTVYRHFPTREALFDGLAAWVRTTVHDLADPLRADAVPSEIAASFASFDEHEPMMRGFLATPGGRELRAHARRRRLGRIDAALDEALTGCDPTVARHTKAIVGTLCSTATWQALRDEAGLSGAQAGEAVAYAIRTLMGHATEAETKSSRKERA